LLLSFFNRGSILTKEKEVLKCSRCGICVNVCSLKSDKVYLEKKKKIINHAKCIQCFNCVDVCPEQDCLKIKFLEVVLFKSKFRLR